MTDELREFHEQLTGALEAQDDSALAHALVDARAADIADSFGLLDDEERSQIMFALPPRTAAEVVSLLDESVRSEVVDEMDTESLSTLVAELPPDDAADLLGEMSDEDADEVLDHMVDEKSEQIEELLAYDEETAGGIMTPDVVAVPATATVADAVEHVRRASQDEDLTEIYIVDEKKRLLGIVPLRRLVTSAAQTKLLDICDRDIVTVSVTDDQETVVQTIRKYDAMEAAVVDSQGRLIGRITHDDAMDVADEEAEEDILRLAGTDSAELESRSILHAARIRLMWLLPCMIGMMATASVLAASNPKFPIHLFNTLILFVPLLGAMGGNVGIQISTVIVRGFATGELVSTKFFRAIWREGRIALAMAPICGGLAWALVYFGLPFYKSFQVENTAGIEPARIAMAVGLSMMAAMVGAAGFGITLPFVFRRLGADPAISSGPLVSTLNDVLAVSIYMAIAFAIAN